MTIGITNNLEYRDVVVNFCSVPLRNAFSNPYNISAFLFLQLNIGIKNSKMKLTVKCQHVHFYLYKRRNIFYYYFFKKDNWLPVNHVFPSSEFKRALQKGSKSKWIFPLLCSIKASLRFNYIWAFVAMLQIAHRIIIHRKGKEGKTIKAALWYCATCFSISFVTLYLPHRDVICGKTYRCCFHHSDKEWQVVCHLSQRLKIHFLKIKSKEVCES